MGLDEKYLGIPKASRPREPPRFLTGPGKRISAISGEKKRGGITETVVDSPGTAERRQFRAISRVEGKSGGMLYPEFLLGTALFEVGG